MLDRLQLLIVAWRVLKAGWPILLVIALVVWGPAVAAMTACDLLFRTPLLVPLAIVTVVVVLAIRGIANLMKE